MNVLKNEAGNKYGRLTVISQAGRGKLRHLMWLCRCDCGSESIVVGSALRNGNTKSCGCWNRERSAADGWKHGHSSPTPTYNSWRGMLGRCHSISHEGYAYYAGRGIKVCAQWECSFALFLRDMGERPEGKSIDRIDNNGHYNKDNCRWATPKEQRANRRPQKRRSLETNLC